MARPKTIAQNHDEVSWSEVLEKVDEKRAYLLNGNRYYKGESPITQTVIVQQESYPEKLIVLDEIKIDEDDIQYRIAYWVISDKKLEDGEISVAFGQFASVVPPEDLKRLIEKAEKADWEGPGPV